MRKERRTRNSFLFAHMAHNLLFPPFRVFRHLRVFCVLVLYFPDWGKRDQMPGKAKYLFNSISQPKKMMIPIATMTSPVTRSIIPR